MPPLMLFINVVFVTLEWMAFWVRWPDLCLSSTNIPTYYANTILLYVLIVLSFSVGDDVGEFTMMCVRGYSSVVPDGINLDEKLGAASKAPPPDGIYDKSLFGNKYYCLLIILTVLLTGVLFYIYTSGTTGLPKPAIIKHSR